MGEGNEFKRGAYAGIVNGNSNMISGPMEVILSGANNSIGAIDQTLSEATVIIGGQGNAIFGDCEYAVVVGGSQNIVQNYASVVLGGYKNNQDGIYSVILGGNQVSYIPLDGMGEYEVSAAGLPGTQF